MKKPARLYFAAVLLGALLVPTAPLLPPAAATPQVPFLLVAQERPDPLASVVPHLIARTSSPSAASAPAAKPSAASTPPAAATQSVAPSAASKPSVHIVVSGDTLWSIARRHEMSVGTLARLNGLSEGATLRLGQRLSVNPSAAPAAARPVVRSSAAQTIYHVVASGDTLWSLSRRYGTSVAALAQLNGVDETATLRLGQRLAVQPSASSRVTSASSRVTPRSPSRTIVVQAGQTLSQIAEAQGVSTRALVEANGLRSAHAIRAGQRLTIPAAAAATERATQANLPPLRARAAQGTQILAVGLQRGFFMWPTRGVLTSRFGWRWRRHHNGIDIAAPRGTPIHAARGGLVTFAGWYYGYGLIVMIDHGKGVISMYAHNSAVVVRGGQAVSAGQLIARVGCTGACTGSHVHFEVRVNGRPVNPLRYL